MKIHEKYMSRCIQLAKNGLGNTYPNPLVGSVIVLNDKIIGEGFHFQSGLPHAEVNAIKSVVDNNVLKNATIYVSLEPCSHFGKTPPCADLIIEKGIKKVVIGCTDLNPKVAGKGIKKLMEAGCDVTIGILESECLKLNKRFFTFQKRKRPFIILKWAQTADGFIAPTSKKVDTSVLEKKPIWISNSASRQFTHKMRAEEQAILIGTNTVFMDNPSLTTRDWAGENPTRIILDRTLKIPEEYTILDGQVKTIIFTEKDAENSFNIYYEKINFNKNLVAQICEVLYNHAIQSVIIEGGSQTLQAFIYSNIWDEAYVFTGSANFSEGLKSPNFKGLLTTSTKLNDDMLQIFKNSRS